MAVADATVNVQNKGLQYGMGFFAGIRAYLQPDQKSLAIFRMQDHYERFLQSFKLLGVDAPYTHQELCDKTVELLKKNRPTSDTYIRPFGYPRSEHLTPSLIDPDGYDVGIYMVPLGDYLPVDRGNDVCVSSWRRVSDNVITSRGKLAGAYINSALAKQEAVRNGFEEAIMLNDAGHVAEGSAMNIFMVRGDTLITPSITEDILEGITRRSIIQLATDMGYRVVERPIDRTELYIASELFFSGTGAQVAWIQSVDKRTIGTGGIGEITGKLQKKFFAVVKGTTTEYKHWRTVVS